MILSGEQVAQHRVTVITGHYGTGKTEFAVNLVLSLAKSGKRVRLADLDIVNPYFRSREKKELLESAGAEVICTSQACTNADVPAIPPEVLGILEDERCHGVLDVGGDPVGARVLAQFLPQFRQTDCQLLFISNANRPEVRTAEQAERYLRSIERICGLSCSGIVNNTHLCSETTPGEIRKGARLAAELSERTGIPVLCHTATRTMAEALGEDPSPLFEMDIYMRKPWER